MAASSQPPAKMGPLESFAEFSTAGHLEKVMIALNESGLTPVQKQQLIEEMILSNEIKLELERSDMNRAQQIDFLKQLKKDVKKGKGGGARSRRIKKGRRRSTRR
jgi:hypothetical protein